MPALPQTTPLSTTTQPSPAAPPIPVHSSAAPPAPQPPPAGPPAPPPAPRPPPLAPWRAPALDQRCCAAAWRWSPACGLPPRGPPPSGGTASRPLPGPRSARRRCQPARRPAGSGWPRGGGPVQDGGGGDGGWEGQVTAGKQQLIPAGDAPPMAARPLPWTRPLPPPRTPHPHPPPLPAGAGSHACPPPPSPPPAPAPAAQATAAASTPQAPGLQGRGGAGGTRHSGGMSTLRAAGQGRAGQGSAGGSRQWRDARVKPRPAGLSGWAPTADEHGTERIVRLGPHPLPAPPRPTLSNGPDTHRPLCSPSNDSYA